jgi:hypothetical protein
MTRVEGKEGFPALLRELMWHANFSYEPEYFVYTSRIGPFLVECMAKVYLHPHVIEGAPERPHTFSGTGGSTEAAIQAYANNAITSLRRRYLELNNSYTFAYFPSQVGRNENFVLNPYLEQEPDTRSDRMSKLIWALDASFLCLASELNESRRCLGDMTGVLENLRHRHSIPYIETGAPFVTVPSDFLPNIYLSPVVSGERYQAVPPCYSYVPPEQLREVMGEPRNLTHLEAPGDIGHPSFYFGLPAFPH